VEAAPCLGSRRLPVDRLGLPLDRQSLQVNYRRSRGATELLHPIVPHLRALRTEADLPVAGEMELEVAEFGVAGVGVVVGRVGDFGAGLDDDRLYCSRRNAQERRTEAEAEVLLVDKPVDGATVEDAKEIPAGGRRMIN